MNPAYVDSSCLVAIALEQPAYARVAKALSASPRLLASNLLEAELRSALVREAVTLDPTQLLETIDWLLPERQLSPELERVLATGHLRGADAFHLAHALWLAPDAEGLDFLTLDRAQRVSARQLGFHAPELGRSGEDSKEA